VIDGSSACVAHTGEQVGGTARVLADGLRRVRIGRAERTAGLSRGTLDRDRTEADVIGATIRFVA